VTGVVTVEDSLDGLVDVDLECFDWIYLNGWVPRCSRATTERTGNHHRYGGVLAGDHDRQTASGLRRAV
jgi:hypothetical protein